MKWKGADLHVSITEIGPLGSFINLEYEMLQIVAAQPLCRLPNLLNVKAFANWSYGTTGIGSQMPYVRGDNHCNLCMSYGHCEDQWLMRLCPCNPGDRSCTLRCPAQRLGVFPCGSRNNWHRKLCAYQPKTVPQQALEREQPQEP